MKIPIFSICFILSISLGYSQGSEYNREDYMNMLNQDSRVSLFNINSDSINVESDCGANYDSANRVLYTTKDCRGKFWMENNLSLDTAYEFIFDFSLTADFKNSGSAYPLQAMLGNSPNGFTWLGINKEGQLELSTRDQDGWIDVLKVSKADKVHFDRENHLRFVQFPDGYFYIELNSYKRLSFDLGDTSIKKLPIVGISNRINFYSNVKISNLEMNALTETEPKDDFLAELEDITANMQADQLLSIESNDERLEYRNNMRLLFDNPCFGNCNNGFGVYDFDDGIQYMGQWKDRKFEGIGLVYTNGDLYYDGNFSNGVFHGRGKVYQNGQLVFDGEFKNGEPVID